MCVSLLFIIPLWQSSRRNANHGRFPNLHLARGVLLHLLLFLTPIHSGGAGRGDVILRKAAEEWLPCPTPAGNPRTCCQLRLNPLLFLAGWPGTGPGMQPCQSPGGHPDDLTTLLSRERQMVSGRGENRVPSACGFLTCGWQQRVGKGNGLLVTVVATNALLVPGRGGA